MQNGNFEFKGTPSSAQTFPSISNMPLFYSLLLEAVSFHLDDDVYSDAVHHCMIGLNFAKGDFTADLKHITSLIRLIDSDIERELIDEYKASSKDSLSLFFAKQSMETSRQGRDVIRNMLDKSILDLKAKIQNKLDFDFAQTEGKVRDKQAMAPPSELCTKRMLLKKRIDELIIQNEYPSLIELLLSALEVDPLNPEIYTTLASLSPKYLLSIKGNLDIWTYLWICDVSSSIPYLKVFEMFIVKSNFKQAAEVCSTAVTIINLLDPGARAMIRLGFKLLQIACYQLCNPAKAVELMKTDIYLELKQSKHFKALSVIYSPGKTSEKVIEEFMALVQKIFMDMRSSIHSEPSSTAMECDYKPSLSPLRLF